MAQAVQTPTDTIQQITHEDLQALGFTNIQIERLEDVRERAPYIEFTGSREEWEKLQFLRWLVQHELVTS